MRTIKIGDIVQVMALRVKVLDREGIHCLGQVTEPYRSETWIDIARVGYSADTDSETLRLLGANVHIEGHNPAGLATKLPEAEVRAKFEKIRADIVAQREAKKKADHAAAERQKAAEMKAIKLHDAGQVQREARAEVKQLILDAGPDMAKLADDKKIHKLLLRIGATELIIQTLNSK